MYELIFIAIGLILFATDAISSTELALTCAVCVGVFALRYCGITGGGSEIHTAVYQSITALPRTITDMIADIVVTENRVVRKLDDAYTSVINEHRSKILSPVTMSTMLTKFIHRIQNTLRTARQTYVNHPAESELLKIDERIADLNQQLNTMMTDKANMAQELIDDLVNALGLLITSSDDKSAALLIDADIAEIRRIVQSVSDKKIQHDQPVKEFDPHLGRIDEIFKKYRLANSNFEKIEIIQNQSIRLNDELNNNEKLKHNFTSLENANELTYFLSMRRDCTDFAVKLLQDDVNTKFKSTIICYLACNVGLDIYRLIRSKVDKQALVEILHAIFYVNAYWYPVLDKNDPFKIFDIEVPGYLRYATKEAQIIKYAAMQDISRIMKLIIPDVADPDEFQKDIEQMYKYVELPEPNEHPHLDILEDHLDCEKDLHNRVSTQLLTQDFKLRRTPDTNNLEVWVDNFQLRQIKWDKFGSISMNINNLIIQQRDKLEGVQLNEKNMEAFSHILDFIDIVLIPSFNMDNAEYADEHLDKIHSMKLDMFDTKTKAELFFYLSLLFQQFELSKLDNELYDITTGKLIKIEQNIDQLSKNKQLNRISYIKL